MDPAHRDRVAFVRVVLGEVHARHGGDARAHGQDAQARQAPPVPRAGAHARRGGLGRRHPRPLGPGQPPDRRLPRARARPIEYEGIPRFSPEHFNRVVMLDPAKRKQLKKGLDQLSEEGAVQVFHDPERMERDPVLGAVGVLQFEVIQHRLQRRVRRRDLATRASRSRSRDGSRARASTRSASTTRRASRRSWTSRAGPSSSSRARGTSSARSARTRSSRSSRPSSPAARARRRRPWRRTVVRSLARSATTLARSANDRRRPSRLPLSAIGGTRHERDDADDTEAPRRRSRHTKRRPTPRRERDLRRSRRPPSGAASRARRTCRSRSSTAASATPTCTRSRNEWESVMPTVYPCVPGHEIVGRVAEGRQRRHEVQGGRSRGGRLHGRLVPRRAPRAATGSEQYCDEPGDLHLQRARQAPRRRHVRRLLDEHRRRRGLRAARPRRSSTRRRRAAALRRHHHLLAAAALERREGAEGRRRRASAGSGTWA